MTFDWINSAYQKPPRDGSRFWAYLYDSSIRLMRWGSAEEWAAQEGGKPEDYIDCYVEVDDETEEWNPKFWLPLDAIPQPNDDAPAPEPQRELNSLPASAGRQEIK